MSVVFSGTVQGVFTQKAGNPAQILKIREGVDWINVYNQSQIAKLPQQLPSVGLQFYWQLGMAPGTGIEYMSGSASGPNIAASFFGTTTGTGSLGNDYAGTVAQRTAAGTGRLPFPRNGVSVPLVNGITRIDASSFNLASVGSYSVEWSVQTTEVGQWQIELNGLALDNTVLVDQNPTAGGHPMSGSFLITTSVANSVLAIINPTGNSTALTITPADGAETHANSPTLNIAFLGLSASAGFNMAWLTSGGFTLVTNTVNSFGPSVALTSISGANPPVVLVTPALLAGQLNNGDVVRIFNTVGAQQLGGLDFTIGAVTPGTIGTGTFSLAFMSAMAAATTGSYRRVPYDPYFYPPTRMISKILSSTLNGSNVAIVTLTVTHTFTVGQKIRFMIPTVTALAFGMPALNLVEATILAVGAADADGVLNTITVDVDVSAMGTFAWPLTINGSFTPAQVVPVGENTAQALLSGVNPFQDAENNIGYIGISLAGGANSPAGVAEDVIYWVAGKSFSGGL